MDIIPIALVGTAALAAGIGTVISFKKNEVIGGVCCLAVFGITSLSTGLLYHFKDGIVL